MKAFWDSRAALGPYAGTRDRTLKELEMRAIADHVRDGMRVLDMGCGDGETARYLAERFSVEIDAVDFSQEMLHVANISTPTAAFMNPTAFVNFYQCTLLDWRGGPYDLVYTERCIINLPDWPNQLLAISHLLSLVKPGGKYVMCESCADGLEKINEVRATAGLPAIAPPEHNRYLRAGEVRRAFWRGDLPRYAVKDFTSTYYYLSRVVNAWLAKQEGKEPDYEALVNHLALELPPNLVSGMGQTRLWVFDVA